MPSWRLLEHCLLWELGQAPEKQRAWTSPVLAAAVTVVAVASFVAAAIAGVETVVGLGA